VGQRIFFLHNGSTNDIVAAIEAHASPCSPGQICSEANQVINTFNNTLTPQTTAGHRELPPLSLKRLSF